MHLKFEYLGYFETNQNYYTWVSRSSDKVLFSKLVETRKSLATVPLTSAKFVICLRNGLLRLTVSTYYLSIVLNTEGDMWICASYSGGGGWYR